MADFRGSTALVTGATDGVGRAVATQLGKAGIRLLVHGRDVDRGAQVVDGIVAAGGAAEFLRADLGSLAEVRRLAGTVCERTDRLDLLISNAAVGFGAPGAPRQLSADGHEQRFAVNHLAGYLLTRLLLPLLLASAPARIVNVASAGQHPIDFDDVMLAGGYEGIRAYRRSKLAQIMSTIDLAAELDGSGVTVNALHPAGLMDTTMVREAAYEPLSSVEDGAAAVLSLAVGSGVEGRSGLYFDRLTEARAHDQAYDPDARRRLRALSDALTGLAAPVTPG